MRLGACPMQSSWWNWSTNFSGHMLAPTYSRRSGNQWADELTHPEPAGFCPTLKVDLIPNLPWFPNSWNPRTLQYGHTRRPTRNLWGQGGCADSRIFLIPCGCLRSCPEGRVWILELCLVWSLYGRAGHIGSPLHTGLFRCLILGSRLKTDMFWNQNFGTSLLTGKNLLLSPFIPIFWCMQTETLRQIVFGSYIWLSQCEFGHFLWTKPRYFICDDDTMWNWHVMPNPGRKDSCNH